MLVAKNTFFINLRYKEKQLIGIDKVALMTQKGENYMWRLHKIYNSNVFISPVYRAAL